MEIENPTKKRNIFIFHLFEGYYIVPIIFYINIFIYLAMVVTGAGIFLPDTQTVLEWGANSRLTTLRGQWWRLLTSCFVHYGIIHLYFNMFLFLHIGRFLEAMLGKLRFLTAYLITGIFASIASIWWNDYSISAGASGAIFGMYGVFLAIATSSLIENRKESVKNILTFIGYNLLFGLLMRNIVDNAAHIGGLLSGILIGYLFIPGVKRASTFSKIFSVLVTVLLFTFFSVALIQTISRDILVYFDKAAIIGKNEQHAIACYRSIKDLSTKETVTLIKEEILPAWQENIKISKEIRNLQLPIELYSKAIHLEQYFIYRNRAYELMLKSIEEGADKYGQETTYTLIKDKLSRLLLQSTESNIEKYRLEIERLNTEADKLLKIINK